MKDQHKKIKGYRDLSQAEIDLMNKIKAHAEVTRQLLEGVVAMREDQHSRLELHEAKDISYEEVFESMRCLSLAKEHLQTGQMWFVRAVALPESF